MDRAAGAIGCLALVGAALAAAQSTAAFGVVTWAILALLVTVGFAGLRSPRRVVVWAAGLFLLFASLVLVIFALDAPGEPLELWLGLPRATAVLVYGIWPLGALPGLLYAIEFSREVLPEEKLRAFLADASASRD